MFPVDQIAHHLPSCGMKISDRWRSLHICIKPSRNKTKIWQPCTHSTQFNKHKEPEKPRKYQCLWSQVDVLWSQFVKKLGFLHSGSFFCQQCMYVLAKHEAVFAPVSVYVFFNLVSFLDINFVNHRCVLLVTSLRIASCLCGSATSNLLITHTKKQKKN